MVDAFCAISVDESSEKHQSYIEISIRVLGLCYDIRHAFQGDREVEFVDNGMNEDYLDIAEVVLEAAQERGCVRGDIKLQGIEYPEDIVW